MDTAYMYGLGLAMRNARRMLRDRNFIVPDADAEPYAIASDLYAMATKTGCSIGEAARRSCKHREDPERSIGLWCLDRNVDHTKSRDRMISTDQIKALMDLIEADGNTEHIVISPNKLSPQAKREVVDGIQIFLFEDLFIDLPRHELVPKHVPVALEKARHVLGSSLLDSDLPLLPTTDPIARWYRWAPGTIVFVDNPTMPSFRYVVKA